MPGGVAVHLADVVARRLKIRCRWEKPGLTGRASMLHVAPQDLIDAETVGRAGRPRCDRRGTAASWSRSRQVGSVTAHATRPPF
jgi:hypothetical protein